MPTHITNLEALRELYGPARERALKKEIPALDTHATRFVGLSPFVVLASSDAGGHMDASPRGGEPGFVKMPDAHTLLLPDAPGNNRLDTLENIIATGRLGLLFMVPGFDETLRVNGRAVLSTDPADLALCADALDDRQDYPAAVLLVRSLMFIEKFRHDLDARFDALS